MTDQYLHGVDDTQEQRKEFFFRDIRTPFQMFWEGLCSREGFAVCGICLLGLNLFISAFWFLYAILFLTLYLVRSISSRENALPMRMPNIHHGLDYGDMSPTGGFNKAQGMFYVGNDTKGQELWINKSDILTHMLLLGTTGAGKTETLISLAFNFLAIGSGFMLIDPKAAPKLAAQIYTMCRIMGREDDFLALNYMSDKEAQETMRAKGHQRAPQRQSNSQNPFAIGTANQLTQLLFALMPGDDGQNSIFANNAQTLISGLMFVLVELRDKGERPLSIEVIRFYLMNISIIDELARRTDVSDISINALRAGLSTVGWNLSKDLKGQAKNFEEQYGYARAYFGRALSLLVDNYGRIFKTSHGEVDTVDIITSRRIFVGLIPSMDKDPKELKSLGQICLAGVRAACAVGLGDKIQGSLADVLGALPTDARSPMGIIVDEYAAIETPGFEILLTQGRGLGFAVIVASQDFAGIKRASEAAAEQIVSNCKVKIFMTSEDPRQTYELIRSLAGEAYVLKAQGFSVDKQRNTTNYSDNLSVSAEKMSRVDFRDLQQQIEGQIHVFFKGKLIRGRTFYAAPPLKHKQIVKISYQCKVLDPDIRILRARLGDIRMLKNAIIQRTMDDELIIPHDTGRLESVLSIFERYNKELRFPRMEVAIAALMHFGTQGATVNDIFPIGQGTFSKEFSEVDQPVFEAVSQNEVEEEEVITRKTPISPVNDEADEPDPFGSAFIPPTQSSENKLPDMPEIVAPVQKELLTTIAEQTGPPENARGVVDVLAQQVNAAVGTCYKPPLPESPTVCEADIMRDVTALIDTANWG